MSERVRLGGAYRTGFPFPIPPYRDHLGNVSAINPFDPARGAIMTDVPLFSNCVYFWQGGTFGMRPPDYDPSTFYTYKVNYFLDAPFLDLAELYWRVKSLAMSGFSLTGNYTAAWYDARGAWVNGPVNESFSAVFEAATLGKWIGDTITDSEGQIITREGGTRFSGGSSAEVEEDDPFFDIIHGGASAVILDGEKPLPPIFFSTSRNIHCGSFGFSGVIPMAWGFNTYPNDQNTIYFGIGNAAKANSDIQDWIGNGGEFNRGVPSDVGGNYFVDIGDVTLNFKGRSWVFPLMLYRMYTSSWDDGQGNTINWAIPYDFNSEGHHTFTGGSYTIQTTFDTPIHVVIDTPVYYSYRGKDGDLIYDTTTGEPLTGKKPLLL